MTLGVHRNTVGNYLKGRTALDRRTLVTWAVSTGVPLEWLEHGTVSPPGPGLPARAPGDELAKLTAQKAARTRASDVTRRYLAA